MTGISKDVIDAWASSGTHETLNEFAARRPALLLKSEPSIEQQGRPASYDFDNVLPDSRLRTIFTPRDVVPGPFGWSQPTFCASCGSRGPDTPVEYTTSFFWLCNDCFKKYGNIAGTMVLSDMAFWEMVKQECIEQFGHMLSDAELAAIVASDSSPLATLIKEQQPKPLGG